jgi:hypothetical protein
MTKQMQPKFSLDVLTVPSRCTPSCGPALYGLN